MFARAVLAGAVAAVLGAAPVIGQNTGERVVVNYNEDGMAAITPAVIGGYLRALYAEQAAGGDFWKSGGFDFSIEFRKVEERIQAFLAIAYQGTKAAIFSAAELAALEARRKDLEAASKRDWANVNFGAGAPAPAAALAAPEPSVCAELRMKARDIESTALRERAVIAHFDAEYEQARFNERYLRDVARRLHEHGRTGVTAEELSASELASWAGQYNVNVSSSMELSPYAFYLTLAGAAQKRAEFISSIPLPRANATEYARLQDELTRNNCLKEQEP